jgi:OmpA-OmpF porin, OOP family
MNTSSLVKLGIALGAVLTLGACATTPGEWPLKPGSTGSVTPGHLGETGNKPVRTSQNECVNLGYSVASGEHPKGPPGDCTVQPPPPPPPPVAEPAATPPPPPPAMVERKVQQRVTLQADALFDFDKAVLKPGDRTEINEAIEKIRSKGGRAELITLTGHTDAIGTEAYNYKLGLRRAQAVKEYLVSHGLPADQIKVESKGKSQPIATNKTAAGRAKNRRVDIDFVAVETVTETVPAQ